jgi:hypothetical protein
LTNYNIFMVIWKENKGLLIALVFSTISLIIGTIIMIHLFSTQQNNITDHWQTAIRNLDTDFPNKDHCLDLTAWLSDHYNLVQSSDKYWMQYQGAVYDKAKSLGCSPLPQPIKEINP